MSARPNKDREVPVRIIYRKKAHAGGHHGGAWKVAFADFMTAMFALFLVLWLVNQTSEVKSQVAGYFQDPLGRAEQNGMSIMPGEGAQAQVARPLQERDVLDLSMNRIESMAQRLEQVLKEIPALEGIDRFVEIRVTDEGLEIQLLEDSLGVFFNSGSPDPSLRGRQILALLGRELGALPNPVRVQGYTDARPFTGRAGYGNWELSADRANAARRILTRNGVDDGQVVEIRGHADRELHEPADPFAASNRRVTITLLFTPEEITHRAAPDSTERPAAPRPTPGRVPVPPAAPVIVEAGHE